MPGALSPQPPRVIFVFGAASPSSVRPFGFLSSNPLPGNERHLLEPSIWPRTRNPKGLGCTGCVLATSLIFMYNPLGRARRGTSGALNPKSAIAGSNSPPRARRLPGLLGQVTLMVGSCAARTCEFGQDRKVAAISGYPWVPRGSLA